MVAPKAASNIQLKTVKFSSKYRNKPNKTSWINNDWSLTKSAVRKNQCGFPVAGKKGLMIKKIIRMYRTIFQS
ncbi:MAG: hypothetical protein CL529_06910 [Aequorivita sp.]|nr:hypothetical protein [Aequorivita sp.]